MKFLVEEINLNIPFILSNVTIIKLPKHVFNGYKMVITLFPKTICKNVIKKCFFNLFLLTQNLHFILFM